MARQPWRNVRTMGSLATFCRLSSSAACASYSISIKKLGRIVDVLQHAEAGAAKRSVERRGAADERKHLRRVAERPHLDLQHAFQTFLRLSHGSLPARIGAILALRGHGKGRIKLTARSHWRPSRGRLTLRTKRFHQRG